MLEGNVRSRSIRRDVRSSTKDPSAEPAFFRTLLHSTVFAHMPLDDPSERLHDVIKDFDRPIDVTHFDCRRSPPAWMKGLGIKPVYRRKPSVSAESPSRYH